LSGRNGEQLEIDGLTVGYPRGIAVDGVTVRFAAGTTALVGPNGVGKSSVLRVLAGLQRPTAGAVRLGELRPADQGWQRAVGYLPQEPDLAGGVTLRDTVELGGWLKGMRRSVLGATAERVLDAVGLADRSGDRVRTLSGGMRRRLCFAVAVVHDPAVLLLDEPTAGLDPEQRAELAAVVQGLARDRIVLLSTHVLDDLRRLRCAVAVMSAGRLTFHGSRHELVVAAGRALGRTLDVERAGDLDLAYLSLVDGVVARS
jgi:ABC-type multidrug transport system ATPase subunit